MRIWDDYRLYLGAFLTAFGLLILLYGVHGLAALPSKSSLEVIVGINYGEVEVRRQIGMNGRSRRPQFRVGIDTENGPIGVSIKPPSRHISSELRRLKAGQPVQALVRLNKDRSGELWQLSSNGKEIVSFDARLSQERRSLSYIIFLCLFPLTPGISLLRLAMSSLPSSGSARIEL